MVPQFIADAVAAAAVAAHAALRAQGTTPSILRHGYSNFDLAHARTARVKSCLQRALLSAVHVTMKAVHEMAD